MERQFREQSKVQTLNPVLQVLGECFLMFLMGYIVADACRMLLTGHGF